MANNLIPELVALHRSIQAERYLPMVGEHIVRNPESGDKFWDSYIPFVGPRYEPGGVLLVGTAQSLAKTARKSDFRDWRLATGLPAHPLFRLYRVEGATVARPLTTEEVSFQNIAVQPFEDGIFAGIGGVAMAAKGLGVHRDLNDVTCRIAVTNLFKHSLRTTSGNDLRPWDLPRATAQEYAQVASEQYIRRELEILKPGVVVAFNSETARAIRGLGHPSVYGINDPAWLKRGGGFAAASEGLDDAARKLHASYVSQMRPIYKEQMASRATGYLARYHAELLRPPA